MQHTTTTSDEPHCIEHTFGPGTHIVDPLDIRGITHIRGAGMNQTRIICIPTSDGSEWVRFNQHRGHLRVQNCTISGRLFAAPMHHRRRQSLMVIPGANCTASFDRVAFVDAPSFAVRVIGSREELGATRAEFLNCEFQNGRLSTVKLFNADIRCHDNVDLIVRNCQFRNENTGIGRAGIVHQQMQPHETPSRGSMLVDGCTFENCGYNNRHTYGAIDAYSGVDNVRIINNVVLNPLGRGIGVKADASDVVITGNQVTGLHGEHATACIAMFGSKLERLGCRRIVANNTLQTSETGAKGILVDTSNIDDTAKGEGPLITANVIEHDGVGVLVKRTSGGMIYGNRIHGGHCGIMFDTHTDASAFDGAANTITGYRRQPVVANRQQSRAG